MEALEQRCGMIRLVLQRGHSQGGVKGRPEQAGAGSAEPGRSCYMRELAVLCGPGNGNGIEGQFQEI